MSPTRRAVLAGLASLALPVRLRAQERRVIRRAEHESWIGRRTVSFLCVEGTGEVAHVLEGSDLGARHRPYGTFEIANALIALDLGVEDGPDAVREWDRMRRPSAPHWPAEWRRDHTLASAFATSAPWYFQDLAVDIGDAFQAYLTRWSYGTAQGQGDAFWIDGTLEISIVEQVGFLSALSAGALGVSGAATQITSDISVDEPISGVPVHGKSGIGPVYGRGLGGPYGGWYVGWMQPPDRPQLTFAVYTEATTYREVNDFGRAFSERLLAPILSGEL